MRSKTIDLVVIGLGYVGLPLVQEACRIGLDVTGLDVSSRVVESLNDGKSHVDDLSDADVADMVRSGFKATTDPRVISEASVVVICVPTPLAEGGGPDLTAVSQAVGSVAEHLTPETLVVLESTTWPGTTNGLVLPEIKGRGHELGRDFFLAFSPERIDPGNPIFGLRNTPKVVGGVTPECTSRAVEFYGKLVDSVVPANGPAEAEMAKLLENTYRHINIALVNEMAKFSHDLGIDFWDVVKVASTKPFGFQAFRPGPGVGGHCIPIDPNYLSHHVKAELGYPFRFVELAQEINNSMPGYVARRVQDLLNLHSKAVRGAKVLLLGVTYKPDIADQRESPVRPLAKSLLSMGAELSYHDPYIPTWHVDGSSLNSVDLAAGLRDADVAVLLQNHGAFHAELLRNTECPILDTRGVLDGSHVVRL